MEANRYVTCQSYFYFIMSKSKYWLLLTIMLMFTLWVGVLLARYPHISGVAGWSGQEAMWQLWHKLVLTEILGSSARYEVQGLKSWFKTQQNMWKVRKRNLLLSKKIFCCYPRTSPVWLKAFRRGNSPEIYIALPHVVCARQINRVRYSP